MWDHLENSQIEAFKGSSDWLTVSTKKMVATFEVPAELKNVSFRLFDASGKALTTTYGTIQALYQRGT